jgi:hypothetical protein
MAGGRILLLPALRGFSIQGVKSSFCSGHRGQISIEHFNIVGVSPIIWRRLHQFDDQGSISLVPMEHRILFVSNF